MSRVFGVKRAGLMGPNPTKEVIAEVIRNIIAYGSVELSQDRLAEILLSMLDLIDAAIPSGPTPTTVVINYTSNVLTVTVNGVSDNTNINPVISNGGIFQYDTGAGVYVRASALGITTIKAGGLFTMTIPNNVAFHSIRIHGTNADLDGSNRVTVKIDNFSGISNAADIYPPNITLYDRILGTPPSDGLPWTYNISNSPQYQITDVGASTISLRFLNMDSYLNWGLKLTF